MNFPDEYMKNMMDAKKQMESSGIELQGNLLLVYKRNVSNPVEIDNLNIVLKGLWRLIENRQEQ